MSMHTHVDAMHISIHAAACNSTLVKEAEVDALRAEATARRASRHTQKVRV